MLPLGENAFFSKWTRSPPKSSQLLLDDESVTGNDEEVVADLMTYIWSRGQNLRVVMLEMVQVRRRKKVTR